MRNYISEKYFEWLYNFVCADRYREPLSYRRLLSKLYNTEFVWLIPKDKNRASDGINLRYNFIEDTNDFREEDVLRNLDFPCSVLEMMIALAVRCEATIMDNPQFGDRTGQWFWGMVNNLGLGGMIDSDYDPVYVREVIDTFLRREYSPDGKGGLFRIENCDDDLRDVEIWCQLCWYLDRIS